MTDCNVQDEAGRIDRYILPAVVGVCGYSDSGKTTLIEAVLPLMKSRGVTVGVIKHSHKQVIEADQVSSKDTERYLEAGAAMALLSTPSLQIGIFSGDDQTLFGLLRKCPKTLDLILVEGMKGSGHRKIWLDGLQKTHSDRPPGITVTDVYPNSLGPMERAERFLHWIDLEMARHHEDRRIRGGILAGGRSTRMGKPKSLMAVGGRPMADRVAAALAGTLGEPVILGLGPMPDSLSHCTVLPDPPDAEAAGPIAGLLSALRWDPHAAWLLCGVDMPVLTDNVVRWVLGHRRPGVWAVLPRLPGKAGVEPLLALYEPTIAPLVEEMSLSGERRLQKLTDHPRVLTPGVPEELVPEFANMNTPEDVASLPEWKER